MNKQAQEKIAQEYYNLGVQLAMNNSGLTKEAMGAAGKALGGLAGLGLSPAALHELGLLSSNTGVSQAGALRSLLAGERANAMGYIKGLPAGIRGDLQSANGVAMDLLGRAGRAGKAGLTDASNAIEDLITGMQM